MKCKQFYFSSQVAVLFALLPGTAFAASNGTGNDDAKLTASVETQEFSRHFGSLRTARIEYKDVFDGTTVLVTPTVGRRSSPTQNITSVGGGIEVYHNWNESVSTRTALFVSEDKPVFASLDVAQDISVRTGRRLVATVGARWAEYSGGDKVLFVSAGARRYFHGGSVAYRLTYTDPEGRDGYFAHLINLTINDSKGKGKSQLWASVGSSSIERSQLERNFSENDYGALLRRVQPVSKNLSLQLSAGLTSYSNPAGRIWGKTIGLGIGVGL
jgi:YaiO family outer membrane protein